MQKLEIRAAVQLPDGTIDTFGPERCVAMKLPFKHGWDYWGVYRGARRVVRTPSYARAALYCRQQAQVEVLSPPSKNRKI